MPYQGKELHWLIIDPQNDFCPGGALGVPNADGDMARLAAAMERTRDVTDDIHVTMDSHAQYDIGHPMFWRMKNGKHPVPFQDLLGAVPVSTITVEHLESGEVFPTTDPNPKHAGDLDTVWGWCQHYLTALRDNQRYECQVWPYHCIKGTPGWCIHPALLESILAWEQRHVGMAPIITKGSNPMTEHYSAVKADVPTDDPSTHLNEEFIALIDKPNVLVLVGGIAGSHCVRFTVEDVVNNFGPDHLKNLVLLTDAMSPVPGCEGLQEEFVRKMVDDHGLQTAVTTDF